MNEVKYQYTWRAWIEAFTIFSKYEDMALGSIVAEHDEIYAGPDPSKVSTDDKERLLTCGWEIDPDTGRFYQSV